MDTMIRGCRLVVSTAIIYGGEAWPIFKKKGIQEAEMKFLRSVKGARWFNRYRNYDVRNKHHEIAEN